jgi:hypothetical protein
MGKKPFSFLERAARKEVRRIERKDEAELGNLETEGLEIITAIEGIFQSKKHYSQQAIKQNTLQTK